MPDPTRYPQLASVQEAIWGSAKMRFVFEQEPPDAELVGNVRCACFVGDQVLVIDTEEFGLSAFPGGVLESGEAWGDALERELLEEAGVRPRSVEVVGRLHFWSGLDSPYRPHLPHPEFHQVVAYAEVEVVGRPTNPPGGEHVVSVGRVPIAEAIQRLRVPNPFEADLLSFVRDVRAAHLVAVQSVAAEPLAKSDPQVFPVVVVPYDPTWPRRFEQERVAIVAALGHLDVNVEHIGSTSVPGLAAKPKIDILVGLQSWQDLEIAIDALSRIGYDHEPQLQRDRTFSMRRGRPTTHRVRFVERHGGLWREYLFFRDALRASPALAAQYGALKQELALLHGHDRSHEAYVKGKAPFIEGVLNRRRGPGTEGRGLLS